ncbi:MAG: DUF4432 family protein [Actinobacteria bacterium]|nr:DUF4432 family protein [Actinomycetota bacterium]
MLYEHFRNYGCRLNINYFYKDLRVAVLENEYLRISVLIDKGTDIFEFLYKPKDTDFMWLSPWGINTPSKFVPTVAAKEGNFMDYYEGGWQEVLPNFGYGQVCYGGIEEGLHGEVCLIPWEFQVVEDSTSVVSVKFTVRTYRTPFYLEKVLTLKKDDPKLYISETLKNEGYSEIKFMWTHHPTFGGAFIDDSIVIDVGRNKVRIVYKPEDKGGFLEVNDPSVRWPKLEGFGGSKIDFSKSPTIVKGENESIDEICLGDLDDGWYAVTNTSKKVGFGMKWDKEVFPYVWIWRMYGKGYRTAPWFGRVYCMALELCSSLSPAGLSGAIENNTALKLDPQQEIKTGFIAVAYESLGNIKGIDCKGEIIKMGIFS